MLKGLKKVKTRVTMNPRAPLLPAASPLPSDSMLPECSTTLKRLDSPSFSPLSTGLSRVVVERAQADPPPPPRGLCCRLHRLRSREGPPSDSLGVEPERPAETRQSNAGSFESISILSEAEKCLQCVSVRVREGQGPGGF